MTTPDRLHILFLSLVRQPKVELQFPRDAGQNPRQPYTSLLEIESSPKKTPLPFIYIKFRITSQGGRHACIATSKYKETCNKLALHMEVHAISICKYFSQISSLPTGTCRSSPRSACREHAVSHEWAAQGWARGSTWRFNRHGDLCPHGSGRFADTTDSRQGEVSCSFCTTL